MRKVLLATAILASGVGAAHAQLNIQVAPSVDPITKLAAPDWIYMMTHEVNAANLIGENSVYMLNATGEALSSVMCRGYQLVGPKPYITNDATLAAPSILPAWTATAVPTKTFNEYCKAGVDGQGAVNIYHGNPNAADKSFQNSTWVIFRGASQQ
jgi:hypothetical protein